MQKNVITTEPKYLLKLYMGTNSKKYDCFCDIPEDEIKIVDSWEQVENKEGNTLIFQFEVKKDMKKMIKELNLGNAPVHYLEGEIIDE